MPSLLPHPAHRARRLVALLLLAWLNLALQPVNAAVPAPPADMEDCHHAGVCPEMRAAGCVDDGPVAVAGQRLDDHRDPVAPLLAVLPVDAVQPPRPIHFERHGHPPGAGPPLVILFGHLRN